MGDHIGRDCDLGANYQGPDGLTCGSICLVTWHNPLFGTLPTEWETAFSRPRPGVPRRETHGFSYQRDPSLFCGGGRYTKHVPAASYETCSGCERIGNETCSACERSAIFREQFVQKAEPYKASKESLRCETEPYSLDELLELWLSRGDAGLDSLDGLFSEDEVELFSQLQDCREAAVGELCYLDGGVVAALHLQAMVL